MCLRAPFLVTRKSLAHILRFSLSVAVLQVEYIPCTWVLLQSFSHTLFRCRDSSLYGHVQTISQDLILDLLKRGDLCDFRVFTYIVCFTFLHVLRFHASRVFRVSDFLRFHASHILRTFCDPTQFIFHALAYLVGFVFPRISHFAFLHSHIFCALTCATPCLPGIHCIPFACPVLILQGPLVRISLCFTCIISHMSLHSHLCSLISLCVYITSPLYV